MATTGSNSSAATSEAAAGATDVVVGLATHNHASTAGGVVREVCASLENPPSSLRWCIVAADGGSTDGTLERMREAAGDTPALVVVQYTLQPSDALDVPYHGLPGRARALHAILSEARVRGARACLMLDARSAVSSADWLRAIDALVGEELDFVAPVYHRHPATAGLLHGVVSPVFRALYGVRLVPALAGEFGCSRRLIEAVLGDPVWDTDNGQRGIDLWLSTAAVTGAFHVGQANVGARPADERQDIDVATTVAQVVGLLFTDMERRVQVWQRIRGSRAVPQLGERHTPEAPSLEAAPLVESFRLGYGALQEVWAEVLPPVSILQWRRLAAQPLDSFRVDDALWARTIYDFAMGHRLRVIARDHLLRSLTPMYLAWLASFVLQVRQTGVVDAEARIERLGLAFETEKPYLISQWRWPERFRPVKLRR
jgi:glucosylglycerate synthase